MKYYPEESGIPAPKPIHAAGTVRVKIVPTGERPTLPQAPEDYRPLVGRAEIAEPKGIMCYKRSNQSGEGEKNGDD